MNVLTPILNSLTDLSTVVGERLSRFEAMQPVMSKHGDMDLARFLTPGA